MRPSALLLLLGLSLVALGQESLDLYSQILGFPCVTLMHKDGAIGCTGPRDGASGGLWPLDTEDELNDWIDHTPSDKKVIVLANAIFNRQNVDKLIKTGKVAGILLPADGALPPNGFSPDERFPLQRFGLHRDSSHVWNPWGEPQDSVFAFKRYTTPIWSLHGRRPFSSNSYSSEIVRQAKENKERKGWPQHAVGLHSFMTGGTDSETCMRRGRCDPVGGKSVWSTYEPLDPKKEVVMAITRMDSSAFFHDLAVGADSAASGSIALILAAHLLKEAHHNGELDKQVVFAFFTGESWGYIGSKRFVWDINYFECKEKDKDNADRCAKPFQSSLAFQAIRPDKIAAVIELNQVGNLSKISEDSPVTRIYVHREKISFPKQNSLELAVAAANATMTDVVFLNASSNTPGIPPSSLMSFIQARPLTPGIVLGEFNEEFTNRFYQSRFDTVISVESVCKAASAAAQLIFQVAKNSTAAPRDFTLNCSHSSFAAQLVHCLTQDLGCPLARSYFRAEDKDYETIPTLYAGVFRQRQVLSDTAIFIYNAIINASGTPMPIACNDSRDCGGKDCVLGSCYDTETHFHNALSLAFDLDTQDPDPEHWDTESTWTESRWDTPYLEMYNIDNPAVEIAAFVFGVVEVIVSFAVVYFLRGYFAKKAQ